MLRQPSEHALVAGVLTALLLATACSTQSADGSAGGSTAVPPVPVSVAPVERKAMPVEVLAIGNVESVSSVEIMPRVAGQIATIHFQEGQDVRPDTLLFALDRRLFEVGLAQAEANLAQARAREENASAEARRYTELKTEGIASQEQFDSATSAAIVSSAAVAAADAAVRNARLALDYCEIRAPFGGRTGSLLVHPGAAVKANETALVTLKQLEPIGVAFAVPERHLPAIRKLTTERPLVVRATPRGGDRGVEGHLVFVDNTVNVAAGTIRLKALFANSTRDLWPGEFVDVRLVLNDQPDAIVVPATAVQTGQKGDIVFVVAADRRVEVRQVVVERTAGDEAVIGEGLEPGETVVTDGQLRLVPGAEVVPKGAVEAS